MNCNTCPGGKGTRSQPLPKLPGRFRSSSSTRTKPGPALQAALPSCASWEKVFITKGISYLPLSFKARSRSHLPRKPLLTSLGSASGLHTHCGSLLIASGSSAKAGSQYPAQARHVADTQPMPAGKVNAGMKMNSVRA